MAERLLQSWLGLNVPMHVEPRRLWLDGSGDPFDVDGKESTWVLPAALAGVRRLKPTTEATFDDLLRLAEELGASDASEESICDLQDWLSSDGAEGFDVELHESFAEVLETACSLSGETSLKFKSVRALATASMTGAVKVLSQDLDLAGVSELFLDIELDDTRHGSPSHSAAEDDDDDLESAQAWASATLHTVFSNPVLRDHVEPRQVARQLGAWLAQDGGEAALSVLAGLFAAQDTFSKRTFEALDVHVVLQRLARTLTLTSSASFQHLQTILKSSTAQQQAAFVQTLLERSAGDANALALVRVLGGALTVPRLLRMVATDALTPTAASSAARCFGASLTEGSTLTLWLQQISPSAAVAVLLALPRDVLQQRLKDAVDVMLRAPDVAEAGGLLRELHALDADALTPLFLCVLTSSRASSALSPRAVNDICVSLCATQPGRRGLIDVVYNRALELDVRFAALRMASRQPEVAAGVLQKKLSRFDAPELRKRVQALRDRTHRANALKESA